MRNSELAHALTDWLHIAWITEGQSLNAERDGSSATSITQPDHPLGKYVGLMNLETF
jgi:hypothetical protein